MGKSVSAAQQAAILHVDMDMFFVAVELLEHPELVGVPVIVAAQSSRSVVLSASYEARAYGVRAGMPLGRAQAMCPRGVVLTPHYDLYPKYSAIIMSLFHEITDCVEQISVDEAFLDVSGAIRRLGPPVVIARMLRSHIRQKTGLNASVGIGANKTVAKIASTHAKPDGLLLVSAQDTADFLAQLPVGALWGVGRKTADVLHAAGIQKIADVVDCGPEKLIRLVGVASGSHIYTLACGKDTRPVVSARADKSLGAEGTFEQDVVDLTVIQREILSLSHRTAGRLRAQGVRARKIVLKLRWSDFKTISRSRTLIHPTCSGQEVYACVRELLEKELPLASPVRLIGVRAEGLCTVNEGAQLSLDGDGEQWAAVETAMDRIRAKFGPVSLGPAAILGHRGTEHRREG